MRREYFLAESLDDVDKAASILHNQLHINGNNIHVISNDRQGIKQHHLHEGSIIDKSDLVRGGEHGALLGIMMGITGCTILVVSMPFWGETELIKQVVLVLTLFGSLMVGCCIGSFVGLLHVNYKICRFNEDLTSGKSLMLVDSNELGIIKRALEKQPIIDKGEGSSFIFPFDEFENQPRLIG
ncbi:hypothetical protein CXF85_21960 [Colwellia sp. 75C3]|uniref:hypothetical protein n=1 Tax=Colwellia sp. 75C3 TaxID=888425 RepID=UPI000C327DF2|nr:hypothetical protein [Colwellia sp. 75C3]PKG80777.1 hypothetical protein CXF85_21960 [Colwellia sp. 75C3]